MATNTGPIVTTNKRKVFKAIAAVKNGGQGLLGGCISGFFDMTKSESPFYQMLEDGHQQFERRLWG